MDLENVLCGAQGQANQKPGATAALQKFFAVFATNNVGGK